MRLLSEWSILITRLVKDRSHFGLNENAWFK